ncbi:phage tail tube protein [Anaerosinus massiliensis]|uniref:phage tail tube protein n=1 Tax=Massilibacillus massiliensis TaxID=1806837 RepID=UPI000DA5ED4A|nr:phage tail tube protein [Massilibacillus massiliensis]
MAAYLQAGDTVNGKEGSVYATIAGRVYNCLEIKKLEAKVEKQKTDIPVLGYRGTQTKAKGYKGTGSVTAYYVSSVMRDLMLQYMNTGVDVYFTMVVTNEDPNSTIGKQRIQLNNCNIDSALLAKIDIEADELEEDYDFTFDSAVALDEFTRPSYFDN